MLPPRSPKPISIELGSPLGNEIRTFDRVDGNIYRTAAQSKFFANEEHRRFVAFARADHDTAVLRLLAILGNHGSHGEVLPRAMINSRPPNPCRPAMPRESSDCRPWAEAKPKRPL
jgi:hypothetical protein